jgi:transcriptional regulator with XRE-family HTH domain
MNRCALGSQRRKRSMAKTLHSRHNKIFLSKLRGLRESQHLRQSDLAGLLGRSQATVSNIERGERRLDLIELRDWLDALDVDFIEFLRVIDAELRALGATQTPAQKGSVGTDNIAAVLKPRRLTAATNAK